MKNKVEPSSTLYCREGNYDQIFKFPNKNIVSIIVFSSHLSNQQMTQNFLSQCDKKNQNHKITAFNSIVMWDDGFCGNIWHRNALLSQLFTLCIEVFQREKKGKETLCL